MQGALGGVLARLLMRRDAASAVRFAESEISRLLSGRVELWELVMTGGLWRVTGQQLENAAGGDDDDDGNGGGGKKSARSAAAAAAAAAEGEEGQLTEEQLLEVFRQTSMFNVRTALADNEGLMGIDELLEAASER